MFFNNHFKLNRTLFLYFFILLPFSFQAVAENNDNNQSLHEDKIFGPNVDSINQKCEKCIPAFESWLKPYDFKTPLCKEFGCRNRCKPEYMVLRTTFIPAFFVLGLTSLYTAEFSEDVVIMGLFGGICGIIVGLPVGLVTGYCQGKLYDNREEADSNYFFSRPRVGISFSPTFGLDKTEGSLFFRFFNRDIKQPDRVSIGACLQEYFSEFIPTINKIFADVYWRMTNWRFINYSCGIRIGYSWGDWSGYSGLDAKVYEKPVSIPYMEVFNRVTINFVDVFYVSFEPSFEFLGPYVHIKKHDRDYPYWRNLRAVLNIGAFLF